MSMIASLKSVSKNKLNELIANPAGLTDYLYNDTEGNVCDVDNAWHAIHFLLNQSVWEPTTLGGSIFLGGESISDEDVGYGPARYFTAKESADISTELATISNSTLLKNFNSLTDETEIYPGFEDNEEDRTYITEHFSSLQKFCASIALSDNCIISYMA